MHRSTSLLVLLVLAFGLALPLAALAAESGCEDETESADCCGGDPFCLCCVHSMTALAGALGGAGAPPDARPLDRSCGAAPPAPSPRDILHVPRLGVSV